LPTMTKIGRNRHGNLFLRVYWQNAESREGTRLADTPENRKQLEFEAARLNRMMKDGTFDYLKEFPNGNRASYFRQDAEHAERKTIRKYYEKWIGRYKPPQAKQARYENYVSNLEHHILPLHGDRYLDQYGVPEIRDLMSVLFSQGLKPKTVKNYLNGSLRSLLRDAKLDRLIAVNPFDELPPRFWPASDSPPPDPFTEEERAEILEYFKAKYMGTWPHAYAFALCLFWTGARPSELLARTWKDIDFRTKMLRIHTSFVRAKVGQVKTAGSNRTIRLFDPVIDILTSIKPLRAQPDDSIFLDRDGERRIDQNHFGQRVFQAALVALKIRHRDFYSTRHTFVTSMLKAGYHPKEIAEYVGNSPAVIYRSYAGLIGGNEGFGALAMVSAKELTQSAAAGNCAPKRAGFTGEV